jgi:hypothetical protein
MPNIVLYIATSVDGYIATANGGDDNGRWCSAIPPGDSQKQPGTRDFRNLQQWGRAVDLSGQKQDCLANDPHCLKLSWGALRLNPRCGISKFLKLTNH